tara:strand:- start:1358 stop:1624 length:267 start_codon:yes stop_codon:yes gene_type:complete
MKKTPINALQDAARRYSVAADAAQALGITAVAFRRLCLQHNIAWKNERRWRDGASKKYVDKCATKECNGYPSSNGLCFSCYARERRTQ